LPRPGESCQVRSQGPWALVSEWQRRQNSRVKEAGGQPVRAAGCWGLVRHGMGPLETHQARQRRKSPAGPGPPTDSQGVVKVPRTLRATPAAPAVPPNWRTLVDLKAGHGANRHQQSARPVSTTRGGRPIGQQRLGSSRVVLAQLAGPVGEKTGRRKKR